MQLKRKEIKVTTRFMIGKLLIFEKLSLKSLIYSLTEVFYFPSEKTKEIYNKYHIEKVEMYHILTDTDSKVLQFIIVSNPNSNISEKFCQDIIFEVIIANDIYDRFDTSHLFWNNFKAQIESRKKNLDITRQSILICRAM